MGAELTMDSSSLYREEVFTDRKVGTIRVLTPVQASGSPDLGRQVLYVGEAQLLTTAGALPLSFEIDARSLDEAVSKYANAAKQAFERAIEELQELRRQASSSIVRRQSPGSATLPLCMLTGVLYVAAKASRNFFAASSLPP